MDNVRILPVGDIGRGFVPKEYIPESHDEWYLRNQ